MTFRLSRSFQIIIILLISIYACVAQQGSNTSKTFEGFKITEQVVWDNFLKSSLEYGDFNQTIKLFSASSNQITKVDEEYFKNATNLEVFLMQNNSEFRFKQNRTFLVHQKLYNISLDFCNIDDIYYKTFSMLPNLTSLSMNHNFIKTLNKSIFRNNTNLKYLFVNSNNIITIEPDLLYNKTHFIELQMNFNPNFSFVEHAEFLVNNYSTSYECEYCNLTYIYRKTFSGLPNLKRLILNHNNISHITLSSFEENKLIEVLELNNNSLTSIPMDIFDYKQLIVFHIDFNKFMPSEENNILKAKYMNRTISYRSKFSPIAGEDYFENKLGNFETTTAEPTSTTKKPNLNIEDQCKKTITEGVVNIQGATIGAYLAGIVLFQIIVLVLTICCWIKKSREESSDYIDYSKTVLNEHDIYKMN